MQPATGDLFALTVDVNRLDQGLWQDVCSATSSGCASSTVTFARQLPTGALEDGSGAIAVGDYSLSLAAVPVAGDTLLFAGTTDIFRCSLAAGCVFRNATNTATCAAAKVAPFEHAFDTTFAGTLSLMYFGNDSGLWRSTDNVDQTQPPCSADDANHFQNLNGGLGSLAEVQAFAEDPANSAILLAGLGANGNAASTASGQTVWPQVLDGFGSYVAIDPANSRNWYAQSSSGVGIDLCANGSSCLPADFGAPVIGYAQVGLDAYAFPEPAPFLLDPQGSANLILGTCHVWRGPADGLSWSEANLLGDLYPGEGPDCDGNALIQSLAATGTVSTPPGNTEFIYAGLAGVGIQGPQAYAGHLFSAAVSDAAPVPGSWTDLWLSPVVNEPNGFNPQDFSISSITADSHDSTGQTVYVTIEGFDTDLASTGTVYASTNGGASWVNITSNLPGAPANSIAVDPNDANTVYVALDTGVYITTAVTTCATENCWSVYGIGLPNAPVVQLATFNSGGQSLLRAATYGRGIWQVPLITAVATATTLTVAPTSLTFASQQVQTQSAAQTVTITNTGTIAMIVKEVAVGGDFAAVNNCGSFGRGRRQLHRGCDLYPDCDRRPRCDPDYIRKYRGRTGHCPAHRNRLTSRGDRPSANLDEFRIEPDRCGYHAAPEHHDLQHRRGRGRFACADGDGRLFDCRQYVRSQSGPELRLHRRPVFHPHYLRPENRNLFHYRRCRHADGDSNGYWSRAGDRHHQPDRIVVCRPGGWHRKRGSGSHPDQFRRLPAHLDLGVCPGRFSRP